jgi:hypothetical protein
MRPFCFGATFGATFGLIFSRSPLWRNAQTELERSEEGWEHEILTYW